MARSIGVLVVDDSALMRKMIRQMLEDSGGFTVATAKTGRDALDQLDEVDPDVVTLDVNMPEMDGLTCLNEIMRRRPRPVVMVSSLTEHGALVTLEALELGAVDYVPKPGGTVSLNLRDVATDLVERVRSAADARIPPRRGIVGDPGRPPAHRSTPARPPAPARGRPARRGTVEAVLIGSSTGGPGLLTTVLSQLPARFPAPIVVAQHLPATFTGALADRLDSASQLRVSHVEGVVAMQPGTVYIGCGDADVVVNARAGDLLVRSVPAGAGYRWHPSVDRLVASARSAIAPERLVGVLLTGMGDDGAEEMAGLHADGGRTIAESAESAVVWGMPGALVKRGGATVVTAGGAVAGQLVDWVC